jgi:hypothetical protein
MYRAGYVFTGSFNLQRQCAEGIPETSAELLHLTFAVFEGPESFQQAKVLGPFPIETKDSGPKRAYINVSNRIIGVAAAQNMRIIVDVRVSPKNKPNSTISIGWGSFEIFESKKAILMGNW